MSMLRSIAAVLLMLSVLSITAASQDTARHAVVPLGPIPSAQWVETVSGDPTKAGAPYVIRIHNDAGYVVLPHSHPEDENIVVVQGSWSLAMGASFNRSDLESMEVGAYGFVPKRMAHYAWSKTETIIQVHGIGPFSTDLVDPAYELSEAGVSRITTMGRPGQRVQSPAGCFTLRLGDRVSGALGEGPVVGALCSPANQFTQYWVEELDGERFWATAEELTTR